MGVASDTFRYWSFSSESRYVSGTSFGLSSSVSMNNVTVSHTRGFQSNASGNFKKLDSLSRDLQYHTINGVAYPILKAGTETVPGTEVQTWVNSQNGASLGFGWGYSILRNGAWIDSVRMSYTGHPGNGTVNNQTRSFTATNVTVQDGDVLVPLFNVTGPSTTYVVGCSITAFKIEGYASLNSTEGLYNGAVTTSASGTSYKGEWIQIQYPYPLRLQSWVFNPRMGNPAKFVICASNDGTNWVTLYNQSTVLTWTSAAQTFDIDNDLHYTHYRFVCISTTSYAYFDGYAQNLYSSKESILISNTTSSNSISTGALQVSGGVGIAGNLYAANLYSGGNLVSTQNDLLNYNTKSEITTLLGNKVDTSVLSSYYTKTDTDAAISTAIAGKAPVFSVSIPDLLQ